MASLSHHWLLIWTYPVRWGKGSAVASLSLSYCWSLIWPHPVRRGKGRKCIIFPFDGTEAARPDLRYTSFSLTKLRRGRAYATCSQIPPAAAHLVTSRRSPGIPSGLAPLPVFPRRCMWIFHSSLPKTPLIRRTFHIAFSSSHRLRQTQPCCYLPLGQGICFFFVVACVMNYYWPVIVSFLPLF